jgi:hypothetical protein
VIVVYSVFGLTINANRRIPGLTPLESASPQADIQVSFGLSGPPQVSASAREQFHVTPETSQAGAPLLTASRLASGDYLHLLYADGTAFLLDRKGENVWATWPESLTFEDTAIYFLGPVLTYVLRLRGYLSLHASAVCVGDGAIALLGPQGAGKSTTAAAFATLGHAVLTDDTATVVEQDGRFVVQSGNPRVRLREDSVAGLFGAPDALPLLTPSWNKRYLDLRGDGYRFETRPVPLAAIYVLDERATGTTTVIEGLDGSAALMALVANTSSNQLLDRAMRVSELERVAVLAKHVKLRRVTPADDASNVRKLCETILMDFAGLSIGASNGVQG